MTINNRIPKSEMTNTHVLTRSNATGLQAADRDFQVVDRGGEVLTNVRVHIIYWGSAWSSNASPSMHDVNNTVITVVSSPYLTGLSQYRGIGRGRVGTIIQVNKQVGSSPAEPINNFTHNIIETLVSDLIQHGIVPHPSTDQNLYCVFLPKDYHYKDSNLVGEHNCFSLNDGTLTYYAWITNDGTLTGKNSIPRIVSHEIVEACTDPNPDHPGAFVIPNSSGGADEISDVCQNENDFDFEPGGVMVQTYWSQRDHRCIAPKTLHVSTI
jgi:hypothetical protein